MNNDKFLTHFKYKDSFKYLHSIALPPEKVPVELHDFYEIYFFISGDIKFFIDGKAYEMNKNDLMIINNDELHRATPFSKKPYERIVIHFNKEYLNGFCDDEYRLIDFITKRKVGSGNYIPGVDIHKSNIWNMIEKIEETIQQKPKLYELLIKTYFVQLLFEIKNLYYKILENEIEDKQYDERITEIIEYINNNLKEKITLATIEDKFYINKYYLCHLFKKTTGFTILEYVNHKRLTVSKQMLLDGKPVMDTCYEAGFSDYSNFYKMFKRVTGMSPKKFAKEN